VGGPGEKYLVGGGGRGGAKGGKIVTVRVREGEGGRAVGVMVDRQEDE